MELFIFPIYKNTKIFKMNPTIFMQFFCNISLKFRWVYCVLIFFDCFLNTENIIYKVTNHFEFKMNFKEIFFSSQTRIIFEIFFEKFEYHANLIINIFWAENNFLNLVVTICILNYLYYSSCTNKNKILLLR